MGNGRRLVASVAVLTAVLCGALTSRACTGFAVYSDGALYGMNFDYDPDVPLRLLIDESEGTAAFHLAFVLGPRNVPRTAGMNEHGLFVSMQELHPMVPDAGPPGPGDQCMWGLYLQALSEFESISDIEEHLETHRMVNCRDITLHLLCAEPSGEAMVVEPGEEGHEITRLDEDRIVMTNFANCQFAGSNIEDVHGFGADRYMIAHDYLEENFEGFDIADGLELLKRASWSWTRCSMVFDPAAGEVYLALEGDFERLFRVSIADRTIETYSGYDEHASWALGRWGVPAAGIRDGRLGLIERIEGLFGR